MKPPHIRQAIVFPAIMITWLLLGGRRPGGGAWRRFGGHRAERGARPRSAGWARYTAAHGLSVGMRKWPLTRMPGSKNISAFSSMRIDTRRPAADFGGQDVAVGHVNRAVFC